ncbi:MAG: hypothetical protein ACI9VR_004657 [Cognaticolwellia sp.]|jgi:hypothetical protein
MGELNFGVVPWVLGAVMLTVAAFRLRGLKPDWTHGVVLFVALLASAVVLPLSRIVVEGHEAEYLEILLGQRGLDAGDAAGMPGMQFLLWGLGRLGVGEQGAQAGSLLFGGLACMSWSAAVGRLAGRWVGLAAGLSLALWGNLAAWSSSVYNVVLPFFFVCLAFWALSLLLDGEEPVGAGLLAGAAAGLAVSLRLDTLWVAPAGLLLVVLAKPGGWRMWMPGLLLGAGIAGGSLLAVRGSGEVPGSGEWANSFAMNAGLLVYFEPFQRLWVLPAVLTGLGLGLRQRWRVVLPLVVLLLSVHFAMAGFNDYGSRHLLGAGLTLSAGLGLCTTRRLAWVPLAIAGLGLVSSLVDTRLRFYASEEVFAQALSPELPTWSPKDLGGCALISEDARIAPEGQQLSHFNLWDADELASLQAQHGCVLWLMGLQDYRWSSLAVRDRALRLERLYDLEPLAVVTNPEDGYVALVFRVEGPRGWPPATLVRTLP